MKTLKQACEQASRWEMRKPVKNYVWIFSDEFSKELKKITDNNKKQK